MSTLNNRKKQDEDTIGCLVTALVAALIIAFLIITIK